MSEPNGLSLLRQILGGASAALAGRDPLSPEGVAALAQALRPFRPFEHLGWALTEPGTSWTQLLLVAAAPGAAAPIPWGTRSPKAIVADHEVARIVRADGEATEPAASLRGDAERDVLLVPLRGPGAPIGWMVASWKAGRSEVEEATVAALGLLGDVLGPWLHAAMRRRPSSRPPSTVPTLTMEQAQQIAIAGRLASLGTLAGGVVHEINNPATFIALAAGQIDKGVAAAMGATDPKRAESIHELTEGIQEATRQIRGLVSDFRQFVGGAGRSAMLTVDLERVLTAAAAMTRAAHRHDAQLETDISEIPPCPGQLLAVGPATVNVLVNGIESLGNGPGPRRLMLRARTQNDLLEIVVTDNGCGIVPEHLPLVFDPFFTTKPTDVHAGLGLTVARSVIESLGGTIQLESECGAGTTVRMRVPIP
jgi:signal transduction histidine kinase